jgi:hypothetical protein
MSSLKNGVVVVLHVIVAFLVIFLWDISHYLWDISTPSQEMRYLLLGTGLLVLLSGIIDSDILPNVLVKLGLTAISLIFVLSLTELVLHFTRYNLNAQIQSAWLRVPPFYRMPTVPQGEVFFRRPGPMTWSGRVLHSRIRQLGYLTDIYENDPVVNIQYDSRGFRNDDNLENWEIAVAGDSFTELGYLPEEQLFTSRLGELTDKPVLNLGVSYTGPLTHVRYLKEFGITESTRHLIIVFFEGNDLGDLAREYLALEEWKSLGKRELRQFVSKSSLYSILIQGFRMLDEKLSQKTDHDLVQAFFNFLTERQPVTLVYTPPGKSQIQANSRLMKMLHYFFKEYSSLGDEDMTTWLVFMPCKHRVLYNFIEYSPYTDKKITEWVPSDLPEFMKELSNQYGIRFIDLTPALIAETANSKKLMYNPLYDTHLNRYGSEVVAHELARHLSSSGE